MMKIFNNNLFLLWHVIWEQGEGGLTKQSESPILHWQLEPVKPGGQTHTAVVRLVWTQFPPSYFLNKKIF